jgi:hypothetical protein
MDRREKRVTRWQQTPMERRNLPRCFAHVYHYRGVEVALTDIWMSINLREIVAGDE